MVLSNKKLKQKLRAAKAELLVSAEARSNVDGKDFEKLQSADAKESHSVKILMNTEAKRPKLSKREKQRQKAAQNAEIVKQKQIAGDEEKNTGNELKSSGVDKKKRKRDDGETPEKVKEEKSEQLKKRKKTKSKKKPKKNPKNKLVKEELHEQNGSQPNEEQPVAVAGSSTGSRKELEPSTKVYVGGIPYYSTEDDIRSYFGSCGSITDVDCMEFPDTGKFRGIAIITFKTEAAARRALALDGSDMGGLFLKIQPFKSSTRVKKLANFSPSVVEGYNRIYVGNLSWDVSEDDLRKLFSDCTITSIRFGEDKETGEFKGYAHVDFADSLSLNISLKLDQSIVCGRPVRISCAVPKKGTDTKLKSMQKENHIGGYKVIAVSKDQDISSANVSAVSNDTGNSSVKITADSKGQENNAEATTVSAKIRRRMCYECGEKGHISSSCPVSAVSKDQDTSSAKVNAVKDQENSSPKVAAVSEDQVNSSVKVAADSKGQETNTEVTAVSSKIRRRTCYECGEKGHISSSCPKKQAADSVSPGET